MRKEQLEQILKETGDVHRPIPICDEDTAEYRIARKPCRKRSVIDDCERLDAWRAVTYRVSAAVGTDYDADDPKENLARLSLSDKYVRSGAHSVRFVCPTKLERLNQVAPGRIYAVPTAFRPVERENWESYNLLSAWVYPVAPGMKTITLRMQLHNDGAEKVPDVYDREGAHNVTLKAGQWNQMVLEMPYLARDCVTGVGFEYDMVGHENDACAEIEFYLDQLELREVDCDRYEGWLPKPGRILYSHSGYQQGARKTALAAGIPADSFRVLELETGRVVLEKKIETRDFPAGRFQVMDFTELMEEGSYLLAAGGAFSRAFQIAGDVWESSVWKTLNFFLTERCGYDVPDKHRACHTDMLLRHGPLAIVENGGWHDAADLAQSLPNTIDGTAALLKLARALRGRGRDRLLRRVQEEAKWGLDYVLKMRFGDGYRGTYSSSSIWTDGILGTGDDICTEARNSAFVNYMAAWAETLGEDVFRGEDPAYADWCRKTAAEDYHFARLRWEDLDAQPMRAYQSGDQPFVNADIIDAQICSAGALAAAGLWEATRDPAYQQDAVRFAARLIGCQQQELAGGIPAVGFFYQDRERDLIWHHYHLSYSELPETALKALCDTFPDAPEYIGWYSALALSGCYYRQLYSCAAPYGMIPAGLYQETEARLGEKLQIYLDREENGAERYADMVRQGIPQGNGYYIRHFPVWFSYRGNYNVMLSEAAAMSAGASCRNDPTLAQAVQDQFAFIVGNNPFGQSTMVGEGYDFVQHYAVQPGQTAGSLTVGMESKGSSDAPFWPQVDTATYKEVWICSATKWIWAMADSFLPGKVCGCMLPGTERISFVHLAAGREYAAFPHPVSGYYETELPAGRYRVCANGESRLLTVVSGREYRIDGPLYQFSARADVSGGRISIRLSLQSSTAVGVTLRLSNATGFPASFMMEAGDAVTREYTGQLIDAQKPFVGLAIPDRHLGDAVELLDSRLPQGDAASGER